MINVASLAINKVDKVPDTICTRAKIDTGPFCNYDCTFCYYKDQLSDRRPLEEIYDQIDLAKSYGITSLDFSGGESSVEPHWFNILEYGNKHFDYISCLSHGGKFANKEFLEKSQNMGLKEILFSVHGQSPEVHDSITQRKGSYAKIVQAIENAHELGILVRINCTITIANYKLINIPILNSLNAYQVNFIVENYWGDNEKGQSRIDYKDMSKYLHSYLDEIASANVNVRYIPLCYMKGYEKYVVNFTQLPFDTLDWNLAISFHDDQGCMLSSNLLDDLYRVAESHKTKYYRKPLECLKCKNFYICDGVEKESTTKVYPEEGIRTTDPLEYCRGNLTKR